VNRFDVDNISNKVDFIQVNLGVHELPIFANAIGKLEQVAIFQYLIALISAVDHSSVKMGKNYNKIIQCPYTMGFHFTVLGKYVKYLGVESLAISLQRVSSICRRM
jgi:hypothetical protein